MKHESPFKAYCKLCNKAVDLSNMGKRALTSHAESKSHKKAVSLKQGATAMAQFVKSDKKEGTADEGQSTSTETLTVPLPADEPHSSHQEIPSTSQQLLQTYVTSESVTKAEILWAMKIVLSHFSFRASTDVGGLFQNMFPDSAIAKKFSCGKTKVNYMICFGLASYFKEKLLQKVKEADCITVSFDEALNKDIQAEQMDVIVHYFHEDRVVTQYFDSQFLGHTTADKLLESLKSSLSKLKNRKLLQVSMDGPRVNWKLLKLLCEDREKEDADLPKILNIGSCGLHVVHGAFCTGCQATEWKIEGLLRALWYLFHDTPARRDDYKQVTGSAMFPLKFCATQWIEDDRVAQRALEIWPHVEKYIKHLVKEPKSKQPTSASYITIQNACKDPLVPAKLQVFVYISKVLKPFLVKYQTDEPMIMFLAGDLYDMCWKLMQKYVKKSVLETADTVYKIANLDVLDKKNHKAPAEIEIGFAVKATLANLVQNKAVSDRRIFEFHMDCTKFLSHVTSKILERSPLKYKLVRSLYCLNPQKMIGSPEECTKAFEVVLSKLIETKWRSSTAADDLLEQYKCFLHIVKKEYKFEFKNCKERVDAFLYAHINDRKELEPLWSVFKLLMTLSHSQSIVERGFSVNADVATPNLKEETLVSLRIVYNGMKAMDIDLSSFVVPKELLAHCRGARTRYEQHQADFKKEKCADERT